MRRRNTRSGFTLIEALVALAIAFISLIVGFVALSLVLALSSVYEGVV